MIVFYIVVAMLIIAALMFVLPPLLTRTSQQGAIARDDLNVSVYRDQLVELEQDLLNDVISQDQYEQSKQDIERRLLEDVSGAGSSAVPNVVTHGDSLGGNSRRERLPAIVIALATPILAISIYAWLGTPTAITGSEPIEIEESMSREEVSDQINRMVTQLSTRLEKDPSDGTGWAMLGRSYFALQRFNDATMAFEKAVALVKTDAQLYADFADALAMATGESLDGRPSELIAMALQVDPRNQKALWLAGTAAYEAADFAASLGYWQTLYQMMRPGSESAQAMERNIAEARSLLESQGGVEALAALPDRVKSSSTDGAKQVTGTVRISAKLAAQVVAGDTLFVFAQAPEGPRMPLAVVRATAAELPLSFVLDDSLAMMPNMSVSRFDEIIVTARISKSGTAAAQSGDLEGFSGRIKTGSTDVEVMIDHVIP